MQAEPIRIIMTPIIVKVMPVVGIFVTICLVGLVATAIWVFFLKKEKY